jgi:protocatechuate 4,5-dioxygenase beta chain
MGQIVGGFLVPHDPVMYVLPEAPDKHTADLIWAAYETCADRIAALNPTAAVVVGADHYMLFGTHCLPQYVIGTGTVDGPIDPLPGLGRRKYPSNTALASHIASYGRAHGFDWAEGRDFTIDHSVAIPDQLMLEPVRQKGTAIDLVPIYVASGVDPYISLAKTQQLGRSIRAAVESFAEDERVIVIGSGGISHWVGTQEMGRVNEAFDQGIIRMVKDRAFDEFYGLSDDYILREGGNGGMEIRNFGVAMGAVPYQSAELIEYQPVPEWVTGLGFLELKV